MTQATDPRDAEIIRLRQRERDLLHYNNVQVERRRMITGAARRLREAQKAYLADRGNEDLGCAVGVAAAELDIEIDNALKDISKREPKLLILGYARHGKDTVAEILRDKHNFKFVSSSMFCAERVMMPFFSKFPREGTHVPAFDDRLFRSYQSVEECFEDRIHFRDIWHQQIATYNRPDRSRLSREILEVANIYVGMRSDAEYQASKHLYDDVWWVDAEGRGIPPEPSSSMDIQYNPREMRLINNNGNLNDLRLNIVQGLSDLDTIFRS